MGKNQEIGQNIFTVVHLCVGMRKYNNKTHVHTVIGQKN